MKSSTLMTKIFIAAFIASFFSVGALAQELSATRTGFVNVERLFIEANAAKAAQSKLQREFSSREQKLLEQANSLKAAVEQFKKEGPNMPEDKRNERERALMVLEDDFQKNRREFHEDLNNRKSDEMQAFVQKVNRVVEQVAKKEKFHKIDQDAVYIDPQIDITDKVLEILNTTK